jgi:short-subunit dehydrogenase involved in D-alanine esterification of teichoic acids
MRKHLAPWPREPRWTDAVVRLKILITGGGSGIALELARRYAEANKVVIAGRDEAKLERAAAEAPSCS